VFFALLDRFSTPPTPSHSNDARNQRQSGDLITSVVMNTRCSQKFGRRQSTFVRSSFGALAIGLFAYSAIACAGTKTAINESVEASKFTNRQGLDEHTVDLWRDHILAPEAELAWEKIQWHPSFLTGLREAARLEKPLLLWVMNGHPLGCT